MEHVNPTDDGAAPVVDSQIAEFVATLSRDSARHPSPGLSWHDKRAVAEAVRRRWSAGGPAMARSDDHPIAGPHGPLRLRIHRPAVDAAPQPALIYVHGGGFTLFSLDTHDRLMREYAAGFGGLVVGVDYALSPEAKFPVALEEVVAAIDWVHAAAGTLGIDRRRLAVGGDSAGANLSLSACLSLRDRGDPDRIGALLLNYGFFGPGVDTASARRHGGRGALLTNEELAGFVDNYTGATPHGAHPLAWPTLADLRGLPPSLHVIAECDPLADADRAMAASMAAAGNAVTSTVYRGATHSFLEAVSISALARRALDDSAAWLRSRFDHPA